MYKFNNWNLKRLMLLLLGIMLLGSLVGGCGHKDKDAEKVYDKSDKGSSETAKESQESRGHVERDGTVVLPAGDKELEIKPEPPKTSGEISIVSEASKQDDKSTSSKNTGSSQSSTGADASESSSESSSSTGEPQPEEAAKLTKFKVPITIKDAERSLGLFLPGQIKDIRIQSIRHTDNKQLGTFSSIVAFATKSNKNKDNIFLMLYVYHESQLEEVRKTTSLALNQVGNSKYYVSIQPLMQDSLTTEAYEYYQLVEDNLDTIKSKMLIYKNEE